MAKNAKSKKPAIDTEEDDWGDYKQSQNWAEKRNFYIFGDVDETFASDIVVPFIQQVEELSKLKRPKPLKLYITSEGGYVHYAFDLITHILRAKRLGIEVYTYVSSYAKSAGSLIAVTGSKRYIGEMAFHLLHFMRGWSYSHNPDMSQRNNKNDLFWQEQLANIYKQHTKIKGIEKKLLADNFMVNGADDCIRLGLADEKM